MLLLISRKSSQDIGIRFNKNFFFSCPSFEHWIHLINMKNHLSGWYDILAMLDHQSCCGEKKYFLLMATPSLLPLGTAGMSMDRGRGHHLQLSITPWMRLPGFLVLSRNYEWASLWTSLGKPYNNSPVCVSAQILYQWSVYLYAFFFFNVPTTGFGWPSCCSSKNQSPFLLWGRHLCDAVVCRAIAALLVQSLLSNP